jgi:ParB/RepB/Spo0J family partition protein
LVVKGDPDHDYQIYDGERRWKAAKLVGIPALKAIITTSKSDAETFKGSVVCNFGREGHQPLEIANALVKIRREENLTYEELSELSSFSVSKVTQYTGLLKLEPTVQGMMDPELPEDQRISFSVALEIGKVVLSRQVEAARYILDHHLSLTQVRHYIRKLTAEVGVASVYRERSPKDDYNVMQHFLTSATAKAEQIIDLPGKWTVRDLFRNRPPADAYRTVDSLETLIEKLRKLQTSIKNTLPMRRES